MVSGQKPWAVVVPVKRLAYAKTRLDLPPADRARLALAMAEDTIRACVTSEAVRQVVVVTDDADGAAMAAALGATVVADEPDDGLNPALRHGATRAPADLRIATVSSDLPSLRADDLGAALEAALPYACAIVADAAGTGTVLYAAAGLADFRPAYGERSRTAHVRAGAVDLTDGATARLRRDVDTLADLADAWNLGTGPATRRAAGSIGILPIG